MNPERNLLFGVLARKARLISSEQLDEACRATAEQAHTALGDVLVAKGHITPEQRQQLEAELESQLMALSGDGLATLRANLDAEIMDSLKSIDEPTVQKTIADLLLPPAAPSQDAEVTKLFSFQPGSAQRTGERYEKVRLHATGGIGRIWLARDSDLDREVALKELLAEAGQDPDMRRRFLEEARITGRLEHPGIVPIYELASEKDGKPFYVMRFIKGRTLWEAVREYHTLLRHGQAGPVDLNNLLNSFVTVCNAVAYAHSRGVIHRDLKGPNVILGEFGEVLVLDWGLAKRRVAGAERSEAPDRGFEDSAPATQSHDTQQGHILGTPAYMPPEQAAGRLDLLDARSDVYSLGVMLYEILTGRLPFERDPSAPVPVTPEEKRSSVEELLQRVQNEKPPAPRKINAAVPRALQAICLKALAKRKIDRYASATELARDLQRWLADEPVRVYAEPFSVRVGRWARKHKAIVTGASGLLITAVIALAVSTALIGREQMRTEQARQAALRNFRTARDNVDKFFVQVSENKLLQEPGTQKLRAELLQMAHDFYQESVNEYGDDPTLKGDMGQALLALALAASELGRHESALEKIEDALRIFGDLVRDQPGQPQWMTLQARCYLNQAVFFYRLKKLPEAEEANQKASDLFETLAPTPEQHPELIRRKTYAVGNLGLFYQANRDYTKARKSFEDALTLQKELASLYPAEPIYQDDLAAGHTNLGIILFRMRKLDAAEIHIVKALDIHRELATKLKNIAYERNLGKSLNNMGNVLRARNMPKEAMQMFSDALAIRERLAEKNPDALDYQAELAELYLNIGNIYNRFRETADKADQPDFGAKAETSYERAKDIFEKLLKDSPENPEYLRGLGSALSLLGDTAFFQDKKTARPLYDKSIVILEDLYKKGIRSPDLLGPLRNAYWGIAELEYAAKNWSKSAEWFEKALPLDDGRFREAMREKWLWARLRLISVSAPKQTHAKTAQAIEELAKEKPLDAQIFYNLAGLYRDCVLEAAREKNKTLVKLYADRTVALLLAAEKAGYFEGRSPEKALAPFLEHAEFTAHSDFAALVKRVSEPRP